VAVSRSLSRELERNATRLQANDGLRDVFFSDHQPIARCALLRQPALGASLEQIAADGPGTLYGGTLGERYAAGLRAAGSPMNIQDMASHTADLVPPLIGRYRDLDVRVVPPNSQGFALLQMLALVERLGIDPIHWGRTWGHGPVLPPPLADRDRPARSRPWPCTLGASGRGTWRADRDDPHAMAAPTHYSTGGTIALVAADAGWAVSLIQTCGTASARAFEPARDHRPRSRRVFHPSHPNTRTRSRPGSARSTP
jgi:gamma-glutamyltranspeptidase/glutathione hydrolase